MRYLLFAGEDYYPSGGAYDLIYSSDSLEEAMLGKEQMEKLMEKSTPTRWGPIKAEWAHIYDTKKKIVAKHILLNGGFGWFDGAFEI